MLTINHLSYSYPGDQRRDGLQVLNDISASFEKSRVSVVLGPSGCGKTTLLNLIAGILRPEYGTIKYPDDITSSYHHFGYVFQTPSLLPWRTIRENALFGAEITKRKNAEVISRCDQLLRTYGLSGFEGAYPIALSGGMQQRVSIVRAVLSGAKIILLDEPFSNSDFIIRRELQREISRLVAEEKLIAILVTHDVEDAVRVGDKIIVLTQRPARVNAEIEIPIPRDQRLNGGASLINVLAPYIEQVERAFVAVNERMVSVAAEERHSA